MPEGDELPCCCFVKLKQSRYTLKIVGWRKTGSEG